MLKQPGALSSHLCFVGKPSRLGTSAQQSAKLEPNLHKANTWESLLGFTWNNAFCSEIGFHYIQPTHWRFAKQLFALRFAGDFLKTHCLQIIWISFLGLGLSQALCPGSMWWRTLLASNDSCASNGAPGRKHNEDGLPSKWFNHVLVGVQSCCFSSVLIICVCKSCMSWYYNLIIIYMDMYELGSTHFDTFLLIIAQFTSHRH